MPFSTFMPGLLSQEHLCIPPHLPLIGGLESIETPQIIGTCDNGPSDVRCSSLFTSSMANNHAL